MSNFHVPVILEKDSPLQNTEVRKSKSSTIFNWLLVSLFAFMKYEKDKYKFWVGRNEKPAMDPCWQ